MSDNCWADYDCCVCSGEVKFAEIKLEKGRSTGQGLVRFSTEDDAVRAISILA